jgi:hypothetical protein
MAADEAVLNIVKKNKKSPKKYFLKICVFEFNLATINNLEGSTLTKKVKIIVP